MKQEDYIKKWLDGSLSEEEQKSFEKTKDYSFLSNLDQSLKHFKAPEYDQPFSGLQPKSRVRTISWINPVIRAAASVILVIGAIATYFFVTKSDEVRFNSSQQAEILLPDSSVVRLNADSQLTYDRDEWTTTRTVSLSGEAYFDVRTSSTFEVNTSAGKVVVLGTRFNVQNRQDLFQVSCFEGKVKVIHQGEWIILEARESWQAIGKTTGSITLPNPEKPDWIDGESHFESVPFKYVIEEFKRQYEVEVLTKNIDTDQLYTGSFANDNINLAVKSISLPLNLRFSIEEDQVLLSGDQ